MPQIVEAHITALNHSGQGICHIDGLVTFVDKALPGDFVKIQIEKQKRQYQTASIVEVLKSSSDRITPHCPLADKCGGCQIQHLDYNASLLWKQQTVIDQLTRITGLDEAEATALTKATLPSPDTWSYRNKVSFPVSGTIKNPEIGFYEPRSHNIVDGDVCPVQHPVSNAIRKVVRDWIKTYGILPYNESSHSGLLRHIMVRVAVSTNELMLVLVLNREQAPDSLPYQEELVSAVRLACEEHGFTLASFYLNLQPKATNLILGRNFHLLWGEAFIYEELLDIRYRISPGAFFQINTEQTKHLYSEVLRVLDLKGHETVYDLYCGTGSISLQLARKSKQSIGIELFPAAIDDANENARMNNIDNVQFYVGAAESVVPKLYQEGHTADTIVVDPPRKGCDKKLLDTMLAMQPEKIAYVSCNPATLARDLKHLLQGPYKIVSVQPVDMFPWTTHVECVVLMSRVEK